MRLVGDIQGRHFQIKDILIHSGTTFPTDMEEGQVFYRTDLHQLYIYNGSNWVELLTGSGGSGGGVSSGHVTTLIVDATSDFGRHMYIRDDMITLNYGESGAGITQWGTIKAGIQIDRGSENNVSLYYDEGTDRWMLTNDGSTNRTIVVEDDTNYFLRLDGTNTPSADIDWNSHSITGLADPTNNQDAATKAYVDSLIGSGVFLKIDGSNYPTANISWNGHSIVGLADPSSPQDAATKNYIDTQFTSGTGLGATHYLKLDGSNSPTADISWNSNKITDLADPTSAQDAATKNYTDTEISTLSANVIHTDGSTHPSADISWAGYRLIGLGNPSSDQDATTKIYVDNNFASKTHTHDYTTDLTNTPDDDNFYTLTEKTTTDDNDWLVIYSIADGQYMKVKRSTLLSGTTTPTSNLDIWLIGGFDGSNYLDDVNAYNSSADSWTSTVSDINAPSRGNMQAAKISTNIYITGGFDGSAFSYTDNYDISTDSWTRETDLPNPSRFDNVLVSDGSVYLYAINGFSAGSTYLADNDMYNTTSNTWTSKTDASMSRSSAVGGYVSGIYVISGYDGTSYLDDNLFYDPSTDTWTAKTNISSPTRRDAISGVISDKIYIFSGYDGTNFLRDNDMYDPSTDTWTTKTDIPLPGRTDATGAVYSDKFLLSSGYDGTYYLRDADEYSSASDSWSSKANTPTPARQDAASA